MDKRTEEVLNRPHVLGFTDRMPIGKYKGCTVKSIIEVDPKYLLWFKNTVTTFTLSEEVICQLPKPIQYGSWQDDEWDFECESEYDDDYRPDWGDIF